MILAKLFALLLTSYRNVCLGIEAFNGLNHFTLPPLGGSNPQLLSPPVVSPILAPAQFPVISQQNPIQITLPPPKFNINAPIRIRPGNQDTSKNTVEDVSEDHGGGSFLKTNDCSSPALSLCGQVAWTDVGLSLSGITTKRELCSKYVPAGSCVSHALSNCGLDTDKVSRSTLLAVARVLVHWCYDNGRTLAALDQYHSCYAAALLHAITFDKCLTSLNAKKGLLKSVGATRTSTQGFNIPGVLNAMVGSFGASTVKCMYNSIELTCGAAAADLALKPAMDEFFLRFPTQQPITLVSNDTASSNYSDLASPKNGSQFKFEQASHFVTSSKSAIQTASCYSSVLISLFCILFVQRF